MDPQLKSILSTILLTLDTSLAGAAVHAGWIPGTDQSTIAADLTTTALALIAGALAWYKARQVSQTSMIQAVNAADNGVKVVSETATTAAPVNVPLKGN